MRHLFDHLVHQHDPGLVAVAALVCVLAAFTMFTILEHARLARRRKIRWR